MPAPTILFYDPGSTPWAPKLRQLCAIQGLRLRPVETADLERTVSALSQGLRPAQTPPEGAPIGEPILVFCHLSGSQLDRMLQALRRLGVPRGCLKAVLTSSNAEWTLRALYDELCRERLQLS